MALEEHRRIDGGDAVREGDGFEGAAVECEIADIGDTFRYDYRLKRRATLERGFCDGCDAVRDRIGIAFGVGVLDEHRACLVEEDPVFRIVFRVVPVDGECFEGCTEGECVLSDGCDAGGQADGRDGNAVAERIFADGGDAVRYDYRLERLAVLERTVLYGHDIVCLGTVFDGGGDLEVPRIPVVDMADDGCGMVRRIEVVFEVAYGLGGLRIIPVHIEQGDGRDLQQSGQDQDGREYGGAEPAGILA